MKRRILTLTLALAALATLAGCASDRHTATFGNYKVVYGEMGPVAQRWEIIKASAAGWEVVASAQEDDDSVLVLHKPK
jgi:ABC-type uncharacterized transport system auxiliary subunit